MDSRPFALEGKPSTNPALLDETLQSSALLAAIFDPERRIDLAGILVLVAKHMPGVAPYGPPLYEGHPSSMAGSTMVMPPIRRTAGFQLIGGIVPA